MLKRLFLMSMLWCMFQPMHAELTVTLQLKNELSTAEEQNNKNYRQVALFLEKHDVAEIILLLNTLNEFVTTVEDGELQNIKHLFANKDQKLIEETKKTIGNGFYYKLNLFPLSNNVQRLNENKIKITGIVQASGVGQYGTWEMNGFSNYFIFEQQDDTWVISQTNFNERFGSGYLAYLFVNFFFIMFGLMIFMMVFWIRMLIDCANRSFDNKTRWILIIVFCNFLGAILYYFFVKRILK